MRRVYVRLWALVLMAVAVGCGGETSNNDDGAEDQGGMPFEIMEDLGSGEEDMGDPEEMGRERIPCWQLPGI